MTTKMAIALLSAMLFGSSVWATEPTGMPAIGSEPNARRPLSEGDPKGETPAKSPSTAFLMSLAIPGLGELYTGAKKRAIGFMAAEALIWITYARWRSRGNDLRTEFRAFADRLWDEDRYRDWQTLNQTQGFPVNETHLLPCKDDAPNPGACERVDTQQYYEVIGKYDQFVYGWDDTRDLPLATNNEQIQSGLRLDYEGQRNESNKLLKRASVVVGLAVLNRITSAIHASWLARSVNRADSRSHLRVDVFPANLNGDIAPTLSLSTRF